MTVIEWKRYRLLSANEEMRRWLTIQANLGLTDNTIRAYGRALEDFLAFASRWGRVTASATREDIAAYVHDLAERPNERRARGAEGQSPAGLANATLQQRLTALRLYYDYLVEEGLRADNPVGRGRYTAGKGFGGQRRRGLIPRYRKLPWIPNEDQWQSIIAAAQGDGLRNRAMLAMAYDAALRREELCALATADVDLPTGCFRSGRR